MSDTYGTVAQMIRWHGTNDKTLGSHIPLNFALLSRLDKDSSAAEMKNDFEDMKDLMPAWGETNWVLGNHDTPRVGYRYGENRHESLAIMTMMLPGPNTIYYVSSTFQDYLKQLFYDSI